VEKEVKTIEQLVKISKIEPNREQPRRHFEEDALLELADSIKQFGVLQPLLVQKKGDFYEIIAGERRWRAAKLAGIKEVPVIFINRELGTSKMSGGIFGEALLGVVKLRIASLLGNIKPKKQN
jgi:ParB/RepB/Spo0J family partition protein